MQEESLNKLETGGFQRFLLNNIPYALLAFIFFMYAAPTSKLANVGFYLLVLLPIILAAPSLIKDQVFGRYIRPFVVIIIAWLLLMAAGLDVEWAVFGKKARHVFYTLAFISAIYYALSSRLVTVNKLISYMFWLTVLYSVLSMVVHYGWYDRSLSARLIPVMRLDSPIFVADLLSVYGVSLIYLLLQKNKYLQIFLILSVILFLQYFYNARSALVALCFGLFAMLILTRFQYKKTTLLVAFIMLASYILASAYYGNLLQRGVSYRLDIWLSGIEKALNCNIWIGCGLSDNLGITIADGNVFQHAHNVFIVQLVNTGIVGLLSMLVLLSYLLIKGFLVKSTMVFGLLTGVVALFFDGREVITNPNALWFIFWLPVAQIYWKIAQPLTCRSNN
ncbi:MAG: O-antigen ligase family protein [Cycloclasticus sp.]|nr:O-antigen ligase family protein [Cycloclasticus sp.]